MASRHEGIGLLADLHAAGLQIASERAVDPYRSANDIATLAAMRRQRLAREILAAPMVVTEIDGIPQEGEQ